MTNSGNQTVLKIIFCVIIFTKCIGYNLLKQGKQTYDALYNT